MEGVRYNKWAVDNTDSATVSNTLTKESLEGIYCMFMYVYQVDFLRLDFGSVFMCV